MEKSIKTTRGVYRQTATPNMYIDITSVAELTGYSLKNNTLILGANISLTEAMGVFNNISKENNNSNFAYLAKMRDHINLVANVPIRNIGTIAGNLMIKHTHNEFPSDIFLILETCQAVFVIVDLDGNETLCSAKDFLQINMNKKVIKNIILKEFGSSFQYLSYKIMARAQNTHALVNAGFLFKFKGATVESANIIYGAISPTFIHATKTENYLRGKNVFDNNILKKAFQTLDQELQPEWVLPDARPEFRKMLAIALLYKFVLNVAPSNFISARIKTGGALLERPVSSGTQEFGTNKNSYPLGQPVIKVEALAQTSGKAEYIADIPDRPNQLFAAFVTAKAAPNSTISKIDISKALKMPGVVAYFDKDNIPGENNFMPTALGFTVKEEIFCSGKVQYYDQPIGIIVADKHDVAVQAAEVVQVSYTAAPVKPLLTTRAVLQANAKDRIHHEQTIVPKNRGKNIKKVVKGEFDIGWQYHFHMEVQCCNVVPTEDSLDIYPSSQWMDLAQLAASTALNIPMNRINVRVLRRLGGGFGAKSKMSRNTALPSTRKAARSRTGSQGRAAKAGKTLDAPGKEYVCHKKTVSGIYVRGGGITTRGHSVLGNRLVFGLWSRRK
ncbi:hypothetical protein NQ317_000049 [Molorchus minor]|uniref:FAD-binding PCMH-type domain-containing protein n=1 Tax=Molorchus minor TaxID=1323400 RepID=A0ABQ9IWH6_9CUCU|nr:hypothetical protein NQ317_000049 [Molorchus minor]